MARVRTAARGAPATLAAPAEHRVPVGQRRPPVARATAAVGRVKAVPRAMIPRRVARAATLRAERWALAAARPRAARRAPDPRMAARLRAESLRAARRVAESL